MLVNGNISEAYRNNQNDSSASYQGALDGNRENILQLKMIKLDERWVSRSSDVKGASAV